MFILLGCLSLKNPPAYLVFVKKEIFNEEKNTRLVRKRPAFSQDSAGAIPTNQFILPLPVSCSLDSFYLERC